MLAEEIFYSTFWISMISVIWFYTDVIIQYAQLLGIVETTRLEYLCFVIENPDKYFPDFLYQKSTETNDQGLKFLGKMVSCPFCLLVWLSIIASVINCNFIITAPVYILSLLIVLQIRRML